MRLSDTRAVVMIIDDLQWGDADSAMLLREIMRPPDSPAVLLIAIYRKGFENRSKCLELLRSDESGLPVSADVALEPLTEDAAVRLAMGQMGASPDVAVQLARESGGNPYFLTELLRRAAAGSDSGAVTHLDSLLWERISQLDAAARRFLIATAIAGQPLEIADVFRAAGAGADPEIVTKLKAARLMRTPRGEAQRVDVYHDRVRETVAHRVDDPTPVHAALAAMLDGSSAYSAELKASHWHAAGNRVRAGRLYAQAAKEASDALAFDHAAQLYERALELQTLEPAEALRLRVQLADSLANAGRIAVFQLIKLGMKLP